MFAHSISTACTACHLCKYDATHKREQLGACTCRRLCGEDAGCSMRGGDCNKVVVPAAKRQAAPTRPQPALRSRHLLPAHLLPHRSKNLATTMELSHTAQWCDEEHVSAVVHAVKMHMPLSLSIGHYDSVYMSTKGTDRSETPKDAQYPHLYASCSTKCSHGH